MIPRTLARSAAIDITFTSINAIDINIFAPTSSRTLAGGPVSFHADFNRLFHAPDIFERRAAHEHRPRPGKF